MHLDEYSLCFTTGAVYAILSSYALTFPKHNVMLYGIVPVPALFFVGALCALDYFKFGTGTNTGHAAHLVGALSGAAFWALRIRGRFYA